MDQGINQSLKNGVFVESLVAWLFRGISYIMSGFFLEVFYAVTGIERSVGAPIPRRVPKKYLEGFVSLYMIPIHGIGMLIGFEPMMQLMLDWHVLFRFVVYAVSFTVCEAIGGYVYDKLLGFYSWDYYALSPYKVFKRGYTLWTLVPQWGIAGLLLEQYAKLLQYLSPYVVSYFLGK